MRTFRCFLVLMSAVLLVLLYPAAGASFEPVEMRFDTGASVVTPGGRPEDVKFAEVNAAGGDDLVAVTNTPDALLVYEGDSTGLLTPLVNQTLSETPLCVVAEDFDGDYKTDYAVGTAGGNVLVHWGNGTGKIDTLRPPYVFPFGPGGPVHDLEPIYFDNNTLVDLVSMRRWVGQVDMLQNAGGTFAKTFSVVTPGPFDVAVGHLDGDTYPDFAFTDGVLNQVYPVLNLSGVGLGVQVPEATGNTPRGVSIGDMNGDGLGDIIVANSGDDDVSSFLAGVGGSYTRTDSPVGDMPLLLVTSLFGTSNNFDDVAVLNGYDYTVSILKGNPDGTFDGEAVVPVGTDARAIAWGSMDNDWKYDLVIGNNDLKNLQVLRNTTPPKTTRLAGPDRYETAVELSKDTFTFTGGTVIIATGQNFPDALAGGPLASVKFAPILLTRTDALPLSVIAEIKRLAPAEAIILGGEGAVSENVRAELMAAGVPAAGIKRLGGTDRYETAYLIAKEVDANVFAAGMTQVVVATGTNFPDALAGGVLGGWMYAPVLLVRPDSVPEPTQRALAELPGVTSSFVLGGVGAVSAGVASQMPAPTRLGGADRYETAAAVAEYVRASTPYVTHDMFVATGQNFPDALAVGPVAATHGPAPLLLTRTSSLPPSSRTFIGKWAKQYRGVIVGGGVGAVSEAVVDAMKQAY